MNSLLNTKRPPVFCYGQTNGNLRHPNRIEGGL